MSLEEKLATLPKVLMSGSLFKIDGVDNGNVFYSDGEGEYFTTMDDIKELNEMGELDII